jgi:hypothetical protein
MKMEKRKTAAKIAKAVGKVMVAMAVLCTPWILDCVVTLICNGAA